MDTTEVLPDGKTEAEEVHGQACVVTYCLVILMILGLTVVTILCMPGCKTIPDIPTTTTTTQPPVVDTDLSRYDVQGSFDFRHAKTVLQTTQASIGALGGDGGPFALLTLDRPTPWPTADGFCNAVVVAVWGNTGRYFDYVANGTISHGWRIEHIFGGCEEDGTTPPASGQDIGFFVLSQDGTERSSVAWTKMP